MDREILIVVLKEDMSPSEILETMKNIAMTKGVSSLKTIENVAQFVVGEA